MWRVEKVLVRKGGDMSSTPVKVVENNLPVYRILCRAVRWHTVAGASSDRGCGGTGRLAGRWYPGPATYSAEIPGVSTLLACSFPSAHFAMGFTVLPYSGNSKFRFAVAWYGVGIYFDLWEGAYFLRRWKTASNLLDPRTTAASAATVWP